MPLIRGLSPLLLNAFHTTLNELTNSDLILLFVDASEEIETVIRKISASHEVMNREVHGVPVLICINKVDLATREHLDAVLTETRRIFSEEEILEVSAKTGANVPDLVFLYKSGLPTKEILGRFKKRSDKYRNVKGLLQKLYVRDESTGHVGGIYVFDSKENLEAFRKSDLAKSIGETYKFLEPPTIRALEVARVLFEEKERLI